MADWRSARSERTRTVGQARSLIVTGPDDLRAWFTGYTVAALVSGLAALRSRPGDVVGYATRVPRLRSFVAPQPGSACRHQMQPFRNGKHSDRYSEKLTDTRIAFTCVGLLLRRGVSRCEWQSPRRPATTPSWTSTLDAGAQCSSKARPPRRAQTVGLDHRVVQPIWVRTL
jgi:hypothetical protein